MSRISNAHTVSIAQLSVPSYVASAPAGQWTQISTNNHTSASFPGWGTTYNGYVYPAGGSALLDDLFGVWSGAAYNPAIPELLFTGGGHGSYPGNEIYSFRLDLNRFERVNDPSPFAEIAASGGHYPDGLPQAIHQYGYFEYSTVSGFCCGLSNGGSADTTINRFNPYQRPIAERPWAYDPHSLAAWTNTSTPFKPGYGDGACYDPVLNRFYGGVDRQTNIFEPIVYDVATGSLNYIDMVSHGFPSGFAPHNYCSVAFDSTQRKMWCIGGSFVSAGGSFVRYGTISWTVSNGMWAEHTPSTTGDKTPEVTAGGGLTHDSRRNRMWAWPGKSTNTKDLFWLNPTTLVWTKITPPGATPHVGFYQGTFNKFRYIEAYDILVVCCGNTDTATVQMWMYKPADWMI